MYIHFDDIHNPIQFCLDVIEKEVKQDDRLVKQVLLTLLSTYTRNPINLAINAPTGEGKSYVVSRVAELFPQSDVIFLTAMTDKALFHRQGTLVVKNNDTGKYEPIEKKIAEIDSEIDDKESEMHSTKDINRKQGLRSRLKELDGQKKELLKGAMKLIDLNHKALIFADTPKQTLLEAIMSLLSHDRYEVEYEFVDTFNGIKTKSNVLRGFPTVIFTAAVDYSKHPRWAETQRRFIITNPNMSPEKYKESIQLIGSRSALPEFVYDATIVSENEKDQAREIVKGLKDRILSITERNKPNSPNVLIPYYALLEKSLPSNRASDITTAQRLYNYLALIPVINVDRRPRIITRNKGDPVMKTCPFATFDDLIESIYLMEYSNGIRPYILEWFNEVFLVAFNEKTTPNTKSNDGNISEEIIALASAELVEATERIREKKFSVKQLYENYILPLINAGYIDRVNSKIDHRSYIYFPVLNAKQRKLFDSEQTNNLSQNKLISIIDSTLFPNRNYLISKIHGVLRYSSDTDIIIKLEDHEGNEISVQELVDRYYKNPEDYFEFDNKKNNNSTPGDSSSGRSILIPATKPSEDQSELEIEQGKEQQPLSQSPIQASKEEEQNNSVIEKPSDDYIANAENASKLHERSAENLKYTEIEHDLSKKLFDSQQTINLIYSNEADRQDKEHQQHLSSINTASTTAVPDLAEQIRRTNIIHAGKEFPCVYCDFKTKMKAEYEGHIVITHPDHLPCPTENDLRLNGGRIKRSRNK